MKPLVINNIHIADLPQSWDELSPALMQAICRLALSCHDIITLKTSLALIASRLKPLPYSPALTSEHPDQQLFAFQGKKTGVFLAESASIQMIADNFDFLFEEHNGRKVMESKLVKTIFPRLRTGTNTLYSPDSALFNISFAEFIRLETLNEQLAKNPSDELMNAFAAVLYRPKDPKQNPNHPSFSGDVRLPFNDHLLKRHARITARLHPWQKIYIRLFYDGCRSFIINKHPHAFAPTDQAQSQMSTFESFIHLVTMLTNNDPSKAADIRKAPLWDILPQLEALSKAAKKKP